MSSSSTLFRQAQVPRCKLCNNLDYRGYYDTHGDRLVLDLVIQKLNRDCPFCRLIISSIKSVVDKGGWNARQISSEDGNENDGSVILKLEDGNRIIGCLYYDETNHTEAEVNNTGSSTERARGNFIIYPNDEACQMIPSLTEPPFNKRVTLEYTASIVRQGRSRCSEQHPELPCSKESVGFAPTRLISIGAEAAPLRIVESTAVTGPYATLSYCWGGAKPPSTTKANLSTRLHNIPEDSLPVVFRQSIQLARMLEIPYIWIDSLCIIQDSVEDWDAESQMMFLYYSNGTINIAAATSENPDTPLTKPLDHMWSPASVKVHDQQGTPWLINTRRLPELSESSIDLGPLFTRAWAFQESLFAPRTINFTRQGLVWSCTTLSTLSPSYVHPMTLFVVSPSAGLPGRMSSATRDGNNGIVLTFADWRGLLDQYSSRFLTFPIDRLPAISSAAALFHERLRCRYLAGHWYGDLPRGLAWTRLQSRRSLKPLPREYIAPSWSWASVTQDTVQPSWSWGTPSSPAKLLAVHCDVLGTNPYGRVSSGFIDLHGKIVDISLGVREGICELRHPDWLFFADSPLKQSGDSVSRAIVGDPLSSFKATACGLYMAPVRGALRSGDEPRLVTHWVLVLGWLDPEQTSFMRVGLMKSRTEQAIELFDGAVETTVRIV